MVLVVCSVETKDFKTTIKTVDLVDNPKHNLVVNKIKNQNLREDNSFQ